MLHGKAADVATLVKEQFAGQIFGEQTQGRGQQIQPQDIAMALLTGGRGGPGGRGGGGGGRGNQQTNMGEKKKIKISVATESNSLIVTAPNYLFEEVKDFVAMVDLENVVPNPDVRVVNLKKTRRGYDLQHVGFDGRHQRHGRPRVAVQFCTNGRSRWNE